VGKDGGTGAGGTDAGETSTESSMEPRVEAGRRGLSQRRRPVLTAAAIGIVLVLAGAALLVPRLIATESASPSPVAVASQSPSSSPVPTATPSPMATFTPDSTLATPTPTEAPTPEPWPTLPNQGWPVMAEGDTVEVGPVGPDGTLYTSSGALDKRGHLTKAWLKLPDGQYLVPDLFGPDGSVYGIAYLYAEQQYRLWAFGTDGQLRYDMPLGNEYGTTLALGPSNSLYVLTLKTIDYGWEQVEVTVLNGSGKAVGSWTEELVMHHGSERPFYVQPDGTVLELTTAQDACSWVTLAQDGTFLSKSTTTCWESTARSGSGVVVGVSYDRVERGGMVEITATHVAVFGADGTPVAGWPQTLSGVASLPAFDSTGALYFAVLNATTGESKVLAFDPAGQPLPGWPATIVGQALTGSSAPEDASGIPLPPVLGNGVVFAAGEGSITAFDSAGAVLEGWPYALPAHWSDFWSGATSTVSGWNPGPLYVPQAEGSGLLLLALQDRMVALDVHGQVAPGWPYTNADLWCWRDLAAAPDGDIVGLADLSGGPDLILRWTAAGTFPK
jgi:hypothetical protein